MQHNNISAAPINSSTKDSLPVGGKKNKQTNSNIPLTKQLLKVYKCGRVYTANNKHGYYDLTVRGGGKSKVMASSTTDVYAKE